MMIRKCLLWLWKKTHRVIYRKVQTHYLSDEYMYLPQWWLLWWHCSWKAIGYQYYIPISFETEHEAWEYILIYQSFTIKFLMTKDEINAKLEFYNKKDQMNNRIDELEKDFL